MKIGVFLPNWIGDACMAIPALRALRNHCALHNQKEENIELVGIGRPVSRMLLQDQPWIDRFLVYKPKGKLPMLNRRGLVRAIRREKFDTILLLTNSISTAAIAALGGSRRRIGYNRDGRGWLLTDKIPVERRDGKDVAVPAIQYYSKVIEAYTETPVTDLRMELHTPDADVKQATQLWSSIGFSPSIPTVVLNNNAANSPTRLVPEEIFIDLCKRLATETPYQVLIHCGPSEREQPARIVAALNHSRIQSMSQWKELPIGLSQAVFQRAAAVVTTDSGARHIAIAMNRPVITIFGSTDPTWTTTFNIPEIAIEPTVSCFPCWKANCPLPLETEFHQCMKKLSTDRVLQAIHDAIDQRGN